MTKNSLINSALAFSMLTSANVLAMEEFNPSAEITLPHLSNQWTITGSFSDLRSYGPEFIVNREFTVNPTFPDRLPDFLNFFVTNNLIPEPIKASILNKIAFFVQSRGYTVL